MGEDVHGNGIALLGQWPPCLPCRRVVTTIESVIREIGPGWQGEQDHHGKQAQNRSRRCQVSNRPLSSAVSMVSLQFERANR